MGADALVYCLEQLTDYEQFERLCHDLMVSDGLSVLVDIGEVMPLGVPVYTYRNFPRRPGLTVE
jgi:hypothetical protein